MVDGMSWEIRQGDSLRLLADMADNSVGAVITDPPYSSGGQFRSDRQRSPKSKYLRGDAKSVERLPDFYGDSRTERGLLLWSSLWLAEAWRVTQPGGAILTFCDWRSMPTFSDALQVANWSWRGVGVWTKPKGKTRPTKGGLWNDTEFILWGAKGPTSRDVYLPGSWQAAAPSSTERLHPTEKPQEVLADLVQIAAEGETVLDPFTGSAAVGVAALTAGRKFIGFELSPEYAALGQARLEMATTNGADVLRPGQPGLFD